MAFIWAAQRHGEQRGWVVWSINGSGATCFITPENQDETLNTEDGCIHHWLMPLSGEEKTFNQISWLSPFVMQDFKYDGFAFLCFLNVHMLCWKGQWKDFSLLLQHPHYWYNRPNSYQSYLMLLLQRYQELYFLGLARSFPQLAHWMPLSLTVFSSLSLGTAEPLMSLGSCFRLWFGSSGWLSQRNQLNPPRPLAPLFPAHTCLCVCPCWGHSRRTVGVMRSQTELNGPKQAVQINNLLRLQSSHQEQHSVKCQQQTP